MMELFIYLQTIDCLKTLGVIFCFSGQYYTLFFKVLIVKIKLLMDDGMMRYIGTRGKI